jgi:3-hydroxybutyryl-CoA dehydrogenase
MGKMPLVCRKDVPGFIWNRLQYALLREALWLLDNGVADIETIDAAVADSLAPRWVGGGPFATVDLGGVPTWRRVSENLFPELSTAASPDDVARLDDAGETYYDWTPAALAALRELRAELLRGAHTNGARRRAATPPARKPYAPPG